MKIYILDAASREHTIIFVRVLRDMNERWRVVEGLTNR